MSTPGFEQSSFEQSNEFRRTLNESARLLSQNRPDEAVERLLPLYLQAPDSLDVAINLGGAYILQRKWNRAVRVLEGAAKIHGDNAMVWTNLAAAHLGDLRLAGPRQQKKAIAAYERALQADPFAANVHYHLGLIYKEQGELQQASAMFEAALKVNPLDRDAAYWIERLAAMLAEQRSN